MKIKVGDKVQILSGKDKGKSGKVVQVFVAENRLVVEGLNLLVKHQRARRQGEKGQRIQFPAPLNSSNVALVCPKCNKAARVGWQINQVEGKKKKQRVCRACQELI